ncbi:MAG: MFS transporter [Lachnospiraceae bacterium]|nr:MFS transporter [Lachnospiraceae bacterium]
MSENQTQKKKNTVSIWTPAFISVCGTNAFMNLSKQMSNSILSKYVDSLGATAAIVGLVSSTFALAALIFKFISGPALDSCNRKKILIGAMIALGISFFGYSLSDTVPIIIVFRFLQGAAQAFTATCLLTIASNTLPADKFSSGIGIFALFETVAQAIGPTIGLWLMGIVGFKMTFVISAVLMFVSAIVVVFYKQPPFVQMKKFRISLNSIVAKESVKYALLLFIFNFSFCVVSTYLVIYAAGRGIVDHIGLYFTFYACVMLFSRPMVGKLTDKYGITKIVIPALCCFVTSYMLISVSSRLWMFLLASFFSAFGTGACQPAVQALCMKCVSTERRGAASSTCYIANDLGMLIGAPVAGIIVECFGYTAMWRIMTIPIIFAMIFVICIRKDIKEVEDRFRNN